MMALCNPQELNDECSNSLFIIIVHYNFYKDCPKSLDLTFATIHL